MLIEVILYVVSVLIALRSLIQPTWDSLFIIGSGSWLAEGCAAMGGKYLLELRRLVVPMFLHANPLHLIFNLTFQVQIGYEIEAQLGSCHFLILFFISGICGNLMSAACGYNGVGASTSCFGLIGFRLIQTALIWRVADEAWQHGTQRCLLLNAVIILGWEVFFWNVLDHGGHLGGLLSGAALSVVLSGHGCHLPESQLKWRVAAGLGLCAGIVWCSLQIFFFGSRHVWDWASVCEDLLGGN